MNYIHHDNHNSQTRSRTNISRWKHRVLFTALICLLGFILNLGYGNANQLWHTAQAQLLIPTDSLTVDTSDIEASRAFFYNVFGPNQDIEMSWDGDHESCNQGQEDPALGAMLLQRVNYYRAMAGVPADVTFSEEYNEKAQQAALVMSANNNLSHGITPDWECYTDEADEASRSSNLALYYNQDIWDFVSLYVQDTSNYYVGHRRWVLHPHTKVMGSGTVPQTGEYRATNALWIVDMENLMQPRPQTREDFIAWPPAGYVPYQVTYALWSFSYPGADYSATTITMLENGAEIPVKVEQEYQMSILDNTLVWTPNEMGPDDVWQSVEDEVKYTVTLHDVMVDGNLRDFTYDVILFDPLSAPPQPTATPTDLPTETPAPTDTPEPTATTVATDTPMPTDTMVPTLAPTFTSEPTMIAEEASSDVSSDISDESTTDSLDPLANETDSVEKESPISAEENDTVDESIDLVPENDTSEDDTSNEAELLQEDGAELVIDEATETTSDTEIDEDTTSDIQTEMEDDASEDNTSDETELLQEEGAELALDEVTETTNDTEMMDEDTTSDTQTEMEDDASESGTSNEEEQLQEDEGTELVIDEATETTTDTKMDEDTTSDEAEQLQEDDAELVIDEAAEATTDTEMDAENISDTQAEGDLETEPLSEEPQEDNSNIEGGNESDEPEAPEEGMELDKGDMTVGTANEAQIADLSASEPNTQEEAEDQSQSEELEEDGPEGDTEPNTDLMQGNDVTEDDENVVSDETVTDQDEENSIRSELDASESDTPESSMPENSESMSDDASTDENAAEMTINEMLRLLFLPFIAN